MKQNIAWTTIWLLGMGLFVGLATLQVHNAHGAALVDAQVGNSDAGTDRHEGVGGHRAPVVIPGEETQDWKLRVTVETDTGTPIDVLVMTVPGTQGQTRTWPSKEACVDFQTTDEFKNSLPGLAQHLIADGNDPNHTTVTFNCVPVVKAGSI